MRTATELLLDSLKQGISTVAKATPIGMAYSAAKQVTPYLQNLDKEYNTFTQKTLPQAQAQIQPTLNKVSTVARQAPITYISSKLPQMPKIDLAPMLQNMETSSRNDLRARSQLQKEGTFGPIANSPSLLRSFLTDAKPKTDSIVDSLNKLVPNVLPAINPATAIASHMGARAGLGDAARFAGTMLTGGSYSPEEQEYFRKVRMGEPLTKQDVEIAKRLQTEEMNAMVGSVRGVQAKPGAMKGLGKIDLDGALSSLEKYGFKRGDFTKPEILKTKFRSVVKTLHPDVGGDANEFKSFVDAYNKMTSANIQPTWNFTKITDWIKDLWTKAKAKPTATETKGKLALPGIDDLVKEVKEFDTIPQWISARIDKALGTASNTMEIPALDKIKNEVKDIELQRLTAMAQSEGFESLEQLFDQAKGIVKPVETPAAEILAQPVEESLNPQLEEMLKRRDNLLKTAEQAENPEDVVQIQQTISKLDEAIQQATVREIQTTGDMPDVKLDPVVPPTVPELMRETPAVSSVTANISKVEGAIAEIGKKGQKFLTSLGKKNLSEIDRFNQLSRYAAKNNIKIDLTDSIQVTGKEMETFAKAVEDWKPKDFEVAADKLGAPVKTLKEVTPDQVRVLMQASGVEPVLPQVAEEAVPEVAPEPIVEQPPVEAPQQVQEAPVQAQVSPEELAVNPQLDGTPVPQNPNLSPAKQQETPFDEAVKATEEVLPSQPIEPPPDVPAYNATETLDTNPILSPEREGEFEELVNQFDTVKKTKITQGPKDLLTNVKKKFLNEYAWFNRYAMDAAQEIGRPLQPSEDPALQVQAYSVGTIANVQWWRDQLGTNVIEPSYTLGLNKELSAYLTARRFIHRIDHLQRKAMDMLQNGDELDKKKAMDIVDKIANNAVNPRKFNRKEAEAIITKMEKTLGPEKFAQVQDLATKTYDYLGHVLKQLGIEGIVPQQLVDDLLPYKEGYIPFELLDYANEAFSGAGPRDLKVDYTDYIMPLKGTEEDIVNPLHTVIEKLGEMAKARKNRVFQAFYNAENAKGTLGDSLIEPGVVPVATVETPQGPKTIFRPPRDFHPSVEKGKGVIVGMIDGKKTYLMVDEEIAKAYNESGKYVDDILTKAMGASKRLSSKALTALNLAFTVPNIGRDVGRSLIFSRYSFENPLQAPMFVADMTHAAMSILGRDKDPLMHIYSLGGFEGATPEKIINGNLQAYKAYEPKSWAKFLREKSAVFDKNGLVSSINEFAEDFSKVTFMLRGLRAHGLYEEATQIKTYDQAVDFVNRNREVIDYIAQDNINLVGTPNARKIGTDIKLLNKFVLFFNVNIQGNASEISAFIPKKFETQPIGVEGSRNDPKKARTAMVLRFLFATTIVPIAYKLLVEGREPGFFRKVDDRVEQDYYTIPLRKYKIDPITGEEQEYIFTVPKVQGLPAAMTSMVETFVDYALQLQDVDIAGSTVETMANMSPLGVRFQKNVPAWKSIVAGIASKTVPLIQTPVALLANYDFYRMKPLETDYQKTLPTTERYNSYTTELSKEFSRMSGGALSPMQSDYLIRSVLGDMGTGLARLYDVASGKAPAKMQPEKTYVLSRFIKTVGNAENQAFVTGVKGKLDELKQQYNLLNQYKKSGQIDKYQALVDQNPDILKYNALNGLIGKTKDIEDNIRALSASKDIPDSDRLQRLQEGRDTINQIFTTVNELMGDKIKETKIEQDSKNIVGAAEPGKKQLGTTLKLPKEAQNLPDVSKMTTAKIPVSRTGNQVEAAAPANFKSGSNPKLVIPEVDEILEKTDTGKTPVRVPEFEPPKDQEAFEFQLSTLNKTMGDIDSLVKSLSYDRALSDETKSYYVEQYQKMLNSAKEKRKELASQNIDLYTEYLSTAEGQKWLKAEQAKIKKAAGIKGTVGRKKKVPKFTYKTKSIKAPVLKIAPSLSPAKSTKISIKAPPKARASVSVAPPPRLKLTPIKLPKALQKLLRG